MNRREMEKYRELLRDLIERVRGDYAALEEEARMGTGGEAGGSLSNAPMHLGDLGTEQYMQELGATLLENEREIRTEVVAALRRIDAGTYGRCENCGREIPRERLEALPYTRYCTRCSAALQAGPGVNLNEGRPTSGADTMNPHDDGVLAGPFEGRNQVQFTGLETDVADHHDEPDIHAAGTAGGGTAVGGLAGTNLGAGDPIDADLEAAAGDDRFDVEIEAEEPELGAYSGPSGGAVGGTPANKRAVGGKIHRGIAPEPDPGDSPTGP
jgi:RNA polymerase-binding transcription factor DksA